MRDQRSIAPETLAQASTVRTAVFNLLRSFGIDTIFGNPGSTELPMFRDFPEEFRYILGLQESTVVGMADGYAQASRNAGFINLHSAVGVGHAMGNIFTAYKNCTPLVITAGQQARSILPYEPFLFSQQAAELPKPYVKWSCEPARAQDVPAAIARAYYTAMQAPCGPVLVSVPVDDWDAPAEPLPLRRVSRSVGADPGELKIVADALRACTRPAIVVGAGVDRDGAWNQAVQLAEKHHALVWVAPLSGRCSFPESHPLFAGFLPASRERIVDLLAGHDLILALGAPAFTYHVEGFGPHIPAGSQLYQLVDDPTQAAWAPVGTAVVTGLRHGIAALLEESAGVQRPTPAGRRPAPLVDIGTTITPALVMHTLAQLRPQDSIVVEESPSSRAIMQAHLPIDRPESFYACSSGGLGYAMPASVGVALAKKDRKVIALVGDGSTMYATQALWSAAQLKLPITFIVLNNSRYEALNSFAPVFELDKPVGTDLPGLDFVTIAKGHGCAAQRVSQPAGLKAALQAALNCHEPTLLEIIVD